MGSGYWVFPTVTSDDRQTFDQLWSNTNVCTFTFWPTTNGDIVLSGGGESATIHVVELTGISFSPTPVPVGSNINFTVTLLPANATPPSTLEWSTNVTGSGLSASQIWTNSGNYNVMVGGGTNHPYMCYAIWVPVFAVVGASVDYVALCCGATGGTNTFHVTMDPGEDGSLVFWTGGPLTGTNTGANISISFTNPGVSIITATCGSSFTNFTNVLVRVEIDPLRKTNYFAYGGSNTVTLNLTNSYGDVDWYSDGLKTENVTTNSITIFSDIPTGEYASAAEYTVTAVSRDTGVCVDTAKIFIVRADFTPNPLVIPIGGTGQVQVTVMPDSVASLLVFTNLPPLGGGTNLFSISGSAPLIDVTAGTTNGIGEFIAKINGVSLLSTGQVMVFKASFKTNVIDIPESAIAIVGVEIAPTNATAVALTMLTYGGTDDTIATISGSGAEASLAGHAFGTNQVFITAPPMTNWMATGAVTVVRLTVEGATLAGTKSHILNDMTGVAYPEPNWMYGRATNFPCLILAGSPLLIDVKFKVLPASYTNPVIVQAVGNNQIPPELKKPQGSSNYVIWNGAASRIGSGTNSYPTNVFHGAHYFNWQFTTPQCSNSFFAAGTSVNEAYVALANVSKRHTIVHLACHPGGATTPNEAADHTWSGSGFSALSVTTWDSQPLYYYRAGIAGANGVLTADPLIANKNGQCGAWADLLMEAFRVNGAAPILQPIRVEPVGGIAPLFVVKNWRFGPQYSAQDPITGIFYYTITNLLTTIPQIISTNIGGVATFVTNMNSIVTMTPLPLNGDFGQAKYTGGPGQNEPNPAEAIFGVHYVVTQGGRYLDPSYGRTYQNSDDFKAQSVAGIVDGIYPAVPGYQSILFREPVASDSFTLPPLP